MAATDLMLNVLVAHVNRWREFLSCVTVYSVHNNCTVFNLQMFYTVLCTRLFLLVVNTKEIE